VHVNLFSAKVSEGLRGRALRDAAWQGGGEGAALPRKCGFREMGVIPAKAAPRPFKGECAVEVPAFAE
jgi:hypothetical protein